MKVGVRTEVEIARAIDKGDMDPIVVHPSPAQETVLAALIALGFRFKSADCEKGHLQGSTIPFYQEIEFAPAPQYRGMKELEVKFLAGPSSMDVVFEVDKKGGLLRAGRDAQSRITMDYATYEQVDWQGLLHQHIEEAARRGGILLG